MKTDVLKSMAIKGVNRSRELINTYDETGKQINELSDVVACAIYAATKIICNDVGCKYIKGTDGSSSIAQLDYNFGHDRGTWFRILFDCEEDSSRTIKILHGGRELKELDESDLTQEQLLTYAAIKNVAITVFFMYNRG